MEAYENSQIYKEKNLKVRSRWDEMFVMTNIFPHGLVKVRDEANNNTFKVNGHQRKPYHEGPNLSSTDGEVKVVMLIEPVIPEDTPKEIPDSPS
ncbi:hypothetical protein CR513_26909, partial [Mucuna pruriens]